MSDYVAAMTEVVAVVAPSLKNLGFRKRRHTFNRDAETGIVQVINFQMGGKLPPGSKEVPPIRLDLYGQFTVNLGVFIAEDSERRIKRPRPKFVNEYDCSIRIRLGQVLGHERDVWWPLAGSLDEVGLYIAGNIENAGVSWLDRFRTRESILAEWSQGQLEIICPVPNLLAATILVEQGNKSDAQRAIADHYESWRLNPLHPGHGDYVRELAADLGLDQPG